MSQGISYIFGLFLIMYSARYLGVNNFGILSFAISFTGIFAVFIDFGLQELTIREVAKDNSLVNKYVSNILFIKLILIVIIFGIIIFSVNILDLPVKTKEVTYIITLSICFTAVAQIFNSIFNALEKMEYVSIEKIIISLSLLLTGLLAIKLNLNVVQFSSIYVLTNFLALCYCIYVYLKMPYKLRIEKDDYFLKKNLKEAIPFGLSSIFVVIYYYIDSVMLSIMVSESSVGIYNAAYRLAFAFLIIPSAYYTALYPVMAKFCVISKDSLKNIYEKSFMHMIIIGLIMALVTNIMSEKIIEIMYGDEYLQSATALNILIWAVFFQYISHANFYVLNSTNKQAICTKITFVGMVVNILLNALIIPSYGYIGASLTTLATEAIVFMLLYKNIKKYMGYNFDYKLVYKIFAILMITLVLSYSLRNNVNIYIETGIICGIYFILALKLKIIDQEDLNIIKNLIPDRNTKS